MCESTSKTNKSTPNSPEEIIQNFRDKLENIKTKIKDKIPDFDIRLIESKKSCNHAFDWIEHRDEMGYCDPKSWDKANKIK